MRAPQAHLINYERSRITPRAHKKLKPRLQKRRLPFRIAAFFIVLKRSMHQRDDAKR